MTFSMSWDRSGKPRLSKRAPAVLRRLVEEGHFNQKPMPEYSKPRKRPEQFFRFRKSAVPPVGSNPFGVAPAEEWLDGDRRNNTQDGAPRYLRVVAVGDTHAVVENKATGHRSTVKLTNFSGKPKKLSRVGKVHG
jgi:hypothetical protein